MNLELSGVAIADYTSSNVLFGLSSSYGRWRTLLERPPASASQDPAGPLCAILRSSIAFTGQTIEPGKAQHLHACLARGKELLTTALEWEEPSVGKASSDLARIRGLQWRLVIGWSGLEQILTTLCRSTARPDIDGLFGQLQLCDYSVVPPPHENLVRLKRWREKDSGDDSAGINGFLQAQSSEVKRLLRTWLISGQPLTTWTDAILMAKVFRHISAHGALSATKIREWGLRPALERLVPELGAIAATIFDRMYLECRAAFESELGDPVVRHNRALTMSQPHAEAVMRGLKSVDDRSQPTKTLGRIYIYTSHKRLPSEDENALLSEYGIEGLTAQRLYRGVVLGTIELHACTREGDGYRWHFRDPKLWKRPKLPEGKPQGTWFTPFKADSRE